jgi:LysM repeat protein
MRVKRIGKLGSLGVVTWPLLAGALVLASCGSDTASGSTVSTISLDATNYIVKDPVTTTTEALSGDGANSSGSQTYIVQSGDYAIKVADQFGVPLEDLLNFNGWATGNEFPFPGEEIKIPPGGKTPGAAAVAEEPAAAATETPVGETIPASGSNCEPGSYTIASGDNARSKVANKFDVTVEALDAANSGTSGYSAFYPGLKIVIPAKTDC